MTRQRQQRIEELFHLVADLAPNLRCTRLEAECAGDAALRSDVESLLAHADRATSDPPVTLTTPGQPAPDLPLGSIGPYRLVSKLGEGGCGVVYLARQTQPVRRAVALKLIRQGMDTGQVIARFAAERQALALMDHPGIAHIFDAGATPDGRPYFVMEHVAGMPITDFCDTEQLSLRARLALFVDVCHAVQHAHQKGVIHRDLKPSNILVAMQDGKPAPKVIDFGIAKATAQELTDQTLYTLHGQLIGTPEYMSPEQAQIGPAGLDTTSDIYSLGVILYELIAGVLPFDSAALRNGGPAALQRLLRETTPPRPSTRIAHLARADGAPGDDSRIGRITRARRTDARTLVRQSRRDLDWIVMRAMEKQRGRRYPSATELAADVTRYLAHQPVLAGPPSLGYTLAKWCRRNRTTCISAALVTAALVAGAGVATWQAIRATRLAAGEQRARKAADARTARAEAATTLLNYGLGFLNPNLGDGPELTVRAMVDRAAAEAGTVFAGRPLQEAAARVQLGRTYLGHYALPAAHEQLGRALELLDGASPPVGDADYQHELLLGALFWQSVTAFERGAQLQWHELGRRHLEVAAASTAAAPHLAEPIRRLGGVYQQTPPDAAAARAALDALLVAVRRGPRADDALLSTTASALYLVGGRLHMAEGSPASRDYFRAAVAVYDLVQEQRPFDRDVIDICVVWTRADEPPRLLELARTIMARVERSYPPQNHFRQMCRLQLARAMQWNGLHAEAEPIFLEAYDMLIAATGESAGRVGEATRWMAEFYTSWNLPDRAAPYIERYRTRIGNPGWSPQP